MDGLLWLQSSIYGVRGGHATCSAAACLRSPGEGPARGAVSLRRPWRGIKVVFEAVANASSGILDGTAGEICILAGCLHLRVTKKSAALDGVSRTGEPMTRIASTHVFVDGNNVMGSRPDGWWRDRSAAARRLIAELDPIARGCGGEWMIVFDGLPSLDEEGMSWCTRPIAGCGSACRRSGRRRVAAACCRFEGG